MKKFFVKLLACLAAFAFYLPIVAAAVDLSPGILTFVVIGLGIVLAVAVSWFYRFVDNGFKDPRKSKSAHNDIPPVDLKSLQPRLQIGRSSGSADAAPGFKACRFIWIRAITFCNQTMKEPTLKDCTYVWTAFFYAITKSLRDQHVVDDIYAYFDEAASLYIRECDSRPLTLRAIRCHYHQFRSFLNSSGIDPRTDEGLEDLWMNLSHYVYGGNPPKDATLAFVYNVRMLIDHTKNAYEPKPRERYSLDASRVPVN